MQVVSSPNLFLIFRWRLATRRASFDQTRRRHLAVRNAPDVIAAVFRTRLEFQKRPQQPANCLLSVEVVVIDSLPVKVVHAGAEILNENGLRFSI